MVVDGGTDNTAEVALDAGVFTCVLPVNLGQGAALRLGYELAAAHGARYVVTLDADGQNDPAEMAGMVQPLLDDTADFVVASRRLGVDQTTDWFRQAGVKSMPGCSTPSSPSSLPTPPTDTGPSRSKCSTTSCPTWCRTSTRPRRS